MQRSGMRAAASRAFATEGGQRLTYPIISKEDFGTFKEYSVIHTDRSLNLMSDPFQRVMRDLNTLLKVTYNCDKVAIIPGKQRQRGRRVMKKRILSADARIIFRHRIWYLWNGGRRSPVCY